MAKREGILKRNVNRVAMLILILVILFLLIAFGAKWFGCGGNGGEGVIGSGGGGEGNNDDQPANQNQNPVPNESEPISTDGEDQPYPVVLTPAPEMTGENAILVDGQTIHHADYNTFTRLVAEACTRKLANSPIQEVDIRSEGMDELSAWELEAELEDQLDDGVRVLVNGNDDRPE